MISKMWILIRDILNYELPDGNTIKLNEKRKKIFDILLG